MFYCFVWMPFQGKLKTQEDIENMPAFFNCILSQYCGQGAFSDKMMVVRCITEYRINKHWHEWVLTCRKLDTAMGIVSAILCLLCSIGGRVQWDFRGSPTKKRSRWKANFPRRQLSQPFLHHWLFRENCQVSNEQGFILYNHAEHDQNFHKASLSYRHLNGRGGGPVQMSNLTRAWLLPRNQQWGRNFNIAFNSPISSSLNALCLVLRLSSGILHHFNYCTVAWTAIFSTHYFTCSITDYFQGDEIYSMLIN